MLGVHKFNCKDNEQAPSNDNIIINMNQKYDMLRQIKIPRSISTTNQKTLMKRLNN